MRPRVPWNRTVLVVDDEAAVRMALERQLEDSGYSVVVAASGEEALKLLAKHEVDVIISDQHMPGLSGIDLLKVVRVRYPRIPRIMLTADTSPEVPVRSINESEVYRFIRKPWNHADLRTVVSFAFEVARLEQEKRYLITLMRQQLASPGDPAAIEAELLRLVEGDINDQ